MFVAIIISFAITFILILKNRKKPFPDVYLKINENCKKYEEKWWFY